MKDRFWNVTLRIAMALLFGCFAVWSMEPAPMQYKGQPLQAIATRDGHVYALYGRKPYEQEWLPLTTDTVNRPIFRSDSHLLSATRDRYFYVSVVPDFEGLRIAVMPNYEEEDPNYPIMDHVREWSRKDPGMYVNVHLLSGQQVTTIPLSRPYWGEYARGSWLGDKWICLHHRHGKVSGNFYTLFVNVETGEKRLVGLQIEDEHVTSDSRHIIFTHRGVFFDNFRPVYPNLDEPLPDFGDEQGWKAYREKYSVRKEKRPWERRGEHYITEYALTPDGKKAILLDHRDWAEKKITSLTDLPEDRTVPLGSVLAPELVIIDLDKIETTKDPKQYSGIAVLPKDSRAYLIRDDALGEIRVGARRTVLWRKSFAELATP